MKNIPSLIIVFVLSLSIVGVAEAALFKNEESISQRTSVEEDAFFSGQSVRIEAPVNGELFAAGNNVEISSRPSRSLYAAGNSVRINEGAGYNAFVAGNTIVLKGVIEHDVYIAGQSIVLEPDTHIKGSLRVGGTTVELAGKIDGDVYFSAQRVESNAEIGKLIKGDANQVTFTGGSIGGDLIYRSNNDALGLDTVKISGKTERSPLATNQTSQVQGWLLSLLTAFITGAALLFLMPAKIRDLSQTIRQEWGKSFIVGLAALVLSPIAIILLFSSVVAWPLAVIWTILLIILVYISFIIGEIVLGAYILERFMRDRLNWWIALLVGVIIISLIRIIPALGSIILLVFLIGISIPIMGASLLWWKNKLS